MGEGLAVRSEITMLSGFTAVPFNDASALRAAADEQTCAVMLEPVQGEGGIIPATREYLEAARALCTERGIPLVFDEIQTGMGRTGKLFAYEQFGVEPDVMVLAKGLGNGFPVGALLAREEIAKCFTPGAHGATFGGNPLACAAALATCETLADGVITHGARMGDLLRGKLESLAGRYPFIKEFPIILKTTDTFEQYMIKMDTKHFQLTKFFLLFFFQEG